MFRSTAAFIHYQNYQLIWNHGVVPTKITEYRFQMIQQQEQRRLPVYHEWLDAIGDYRRLLGGYKGMELMLCRGSDELLDALTESGYVLIARRDKWRLFRKGSPG
ncbi:MAG: hypothetical protein FJ278_14350 [Planctomycetes bacterium]|nr:hypothetical protein [Planctomycetota bacterium]